MSEEYEAGAVGYKHPPREHQFRRGQSGNPSGRPKGARNFKSELREELGELVTIRDGERDIRVSKQRALIKTWWRRPSMATSAQRRRYWR